MSAKRKFHDLPKVTDVSSKSTQDRFESTEEFLKFVSNDVIGNDYEFDSPFGKRKVTYCDYIASGKALKSIENYIQHKILPSYGNTHTTTTVTSLQSSMFLQEARFVSIQIFNIEQFKVKINVYFLHILMA